MRPVTTGIALMALLVALLGGGCSSSPPIASSWSDPAAPTKPYHNLLVFGIAANARVRSAYEDNFVAALRKQGVKASAGHGLLPVGGLALGDAFYMSTSSTNNDVTYQWTNFSNSNVSYSLTAEKGDKPSGIST